MDQRKSINWRRFAFGDGIIVRFGVLGDRNAGKFVSQPSHNPESVNRAAVGGIFRPANRVIAIKGEAAL